MTRAEDALLDKLLLEFEAGLNDVMERRVGCNHRAVCPLCRQQLPCDDPRSDADMWFAHLNQIPVIIMPAWKRCTKSARNTWRLVGQHDERTHEETPVPVQRNPMDGRGHDQSA